MRAARSQAFAEELAVRARQRHPAICENIPQEDLIAAMESELAAARAAGLEARSEFKRFSDLAMTFGFGFSTVAPWAAKIFGDAALIPEERLSRVEETGVFVLRSGT